MSRITDEEVAKAMYPNPKWWDDLTSETKFEWHRKAKRLRERFRLTRKPKKRKAKRPSTV